MSNIDIYKDIYFLKSILKIRRQKETAKKSQPSQYSSAILKLRLTGLDDAQAPMQYLSQDGVKILKWIFLLHVTGLYCEFFL